MAMYCGIGGVQKEIGSLYGGVGGVGKELNNVYAGIGGVSKEIHSSKKYLSDLPAGALLKLNETVSGTTTAVPFLVLAHGHHAAEKTTLTRNSPWSVYLIYDSSNNSYNGSDIDLWLTGTYKGYLDTSIQSQLATVSLATGTSSVNRSVFLLSGTEVGVTASDMYTEGTYITYFSGFLSRVAFISGSSVNWWLRSPSSSDTTYVFTIDGGGNISRRSVANINRYARPAVCLPSTLEVSSGVDGDGCYTLI